MRRRTPALDAVVRVARSLGPLGESVAFLGGAIVDLLLTDPAAPPTRPTRDVDLIVEITSRQDYWALQRDLRARGFAEDEEDGILCRWVVAGVKVDVMPSDARILGFGSRWFAPAVRTAQSHTLGDVRVRVVAPPYFVATKLDAFRDPERGAGDVWASHDLQDIVALVDGRPELVAEVEAATSDVRDFIAQAVATSLRERELAEAVVAHLPPDGASQARAPLVLERLRRIAELAR